MSWYTREELMLYKSHARLEGLVVGFILGAACAAAAALALAAAGKW